MFIKYKQKLIVHKVQIKIKVHVLQEIVSGVWEELLAWNGIQPAMEVMGIYLS